MIVARRPLALVLTLLLAGLTAAASAQRAADLTAGGSVGEWRVYAADQHGSRYSPLDQINAGNFQDLKVAWEWDSIDNAVAKARRLTPGPNEATPLFIRGTLYTVTNLNQVAAVNPISGRTIWSYNPESYGNVHRGLAYWERRRGRELDRRLFLATRDSYLIAVDAATGLPVPSFGKEGRVDLLAGLPEPVKRE